MTDYLLSVYQPDGGPTAEADLEAIGRDLTALNDEMRAQDAWVFSGGLHDAAIATVVRARGDDVLVTDGPFTEGKEHLGGFTIVRAPDLDAALGWARRITAITGLPVEVRPFRG